VRTEVLPVYANTHTTASATGMQTTLFRAEARSIVRRALGCENNRDAVLFTGTGCTGAIGKMLDLLKVSHCNTLQHTATHASNISANVLTSSLASVYTVASQLTATYCNTLQHTATHCNSLQHSHQTGHAAVESGSRRWRDATRGRWTIRASLESAAVA